MNDIHVEAPTQDCPHNLKGFPAELAQTIHTNNLEIFNEMASSFINAEKYLKLVEIDGLLDIPSVNELRYVGFHLLKSMESGIIEDVQAEELRRAKRHCERACYDAVELGVLQLLREVSNFQVKYQNYNTASHMSDYHSLLTECESIKDFMGTTSTEDKPEYYDKLYTQYERIRVIKCKLDSVAPSVAYAFQTLKINKFFSFGLFFLALLAGALGYLQFINSSEINELKDVNKKSNDTIIKLNNDINILKGKNKPLNPTSP